MYNNNSFEIEKIFNKDVRYKKTVGRSASKRASRTGRIGLKGVKTASDYMTAKEKRKLNGEVRMTNKYYELENLPVWEDFVKNKSDETIKDILTKLKSKYTQRELTETFAISPGKLYYSYQKYGVAYEKRSESGARGTAAQREFNKKSRLKMQEMRLGLMPTWDEFKKLDEETKKKVVIFARVKVGLKKVSQKWDIPTAYLNEFSKNMNITQYRRAQRIDFDIMDVLPEGIMTIDRAEREAQEAIEAQNQIDSEVINIDNVDDENSNEKNNSVKPGNRVMDYNEYLKMRENEAKNSNDEDKAEPTQIKFSAENSAYKDIIAEDAAEPIALETEYIPKKEHDNEVSELKNEIDNLKEEINKLQERLNENKEMEVPGRTENHVGGNSFNYNINGVFNVEEARARIAPIPHLLIDEYRYKISLKIEAADNR